MTTYDTYSTHMGLLQRMDSLWTAGSAIVKFVKSDPYVFAVSVLVIFLSIYWISTARSARKRNKVGNN